MSTKNKPRPADVRRWVGIVAAETIVTLDGDQRPVVAQGHAKARARTNLTAWGLDDAGQPKPAAAPMNEAKVVDDGTETDMNLTVKATHYVPTPTAGRMHMRMNGIGGDWSRPDIGIKGAIYMPLGGADVIVTIGAADGKGMEHHLTFDARAMIEAAVNAYLAAATKPKHVHTVECAIRCRRPSVDPKTGAPVAS